MKGRVSTHVPELLEGGQFVLESTRLGPAKDGTSYPRTEAGGVRPLVKKLAELWSKETGGTWDEGEKQSPLLGGCSD